MEMQHHPFATRFIIFLIITFVHVPSSAYANDDERYVNCGKLFDCGDIKGVGYPFSGSNRPDYCGHPELKLDCSDQDVEITVKKLTYKVLSINNQSRTLSVARKDYAENICPTLLLNTTWIPNLLNYTSDDRNITIYYGCLAGAPSFANSFQFPCTINTTEMTGYFTAGSASNLDYLASCKDIVEVPVRQSALAKIFSTPTETLLLGILKEGFDLVWSANDSLCATCKASGGQCGYNQTTSAFSCYCKDGPRESSCQQSPTEAKSPSMSSCLLLFFSAGVTLEVNRKTA
uniref:non-specific serine/threonine protein kinase n=1 Tax=Salix viminalis TaxID=40686 RepID=A0A6N2KXH1_SALVM